MYIYIMSSYRLNIPFWNTYKSLIKRQMTDDSSTQNETELLYWQNQLFTRAITYALPVSILVLIPCVFLRIKDGHKCIAASDIFTLGFIMFIALNNRITLNRRKMLITVAITVVSLAMIVLTGAAVMGFIYLFALSIFISLQFSDKLAYAAVALNFIMCAAIAVLLHFQPLSLPELSKSNDLDNWIIYSANFLLMNLITVGLTRQLLNGLNRTTLKVVYLHKELNKEAAEKDFRDAKLKASEMEHYKAIEVRNQQLQEIAYLQSHIVRRPLANIKGISKLLREENEIEVERQLLHYLDISVDQLDGVINEIVKRSEGDHEVTSENKE